MLVPENIIYFNIKSLLDYIKEDFESNTLEKTILYDFFKTDDNGMEMKLHRFDYLQQAKNLFVDSAKVGSSRSLNVTMGYNPQRQGLPTIHILLPNESKFDIGIGMGEGYQDPIIDTDEGTVKAVYTNVQKATYNLMITSDNSSEVVLLYHALKNLMFAAFPAFALRGLRNLEFGGQDVSLNNELMPDTVYHRNLTMTFFYESNVSALSTEKLVSKLIFQGNVVSSNTKI